MANAYVMNKMASIATVPAALRIPAQAAAQSFTLAQHSHSSFEEYLYA
jgi:hypothetical protein